MPNIVFGQIVLSRVRRFQGLLQHELFSAAPCQGGGQTLLEQTSENLRKRVNNCFINENTSSSSSRLFQFRRWSGAHPCPDPANQPPSHHRLLISHASGFLLVSSPISNSAPHSGEHFGARGWGENPLSPREPDLLEQGHERRRFPAWGK